MKLTYNELRMIDEILVQIRKDPEVQKMRLYIQHGEVSTYDHCENVVRVSCWLGNRLPGKNAIDFPTLIIGAFLHDFYQYDWHLLEPHNCTHGFLHPERARRNAVKHFNVNKKTQRIIASHMWPLTFRCIPTSKEAWIVTLADKYCSSYETLFLRKTNRPICG